MRHRTYQDRSDHSIGSCATQVFHYVLVGPEIYLVGFEYPKGVCSTSSVMHSKQV